MTATVAEIIQDWLTREHRSQAYLVARAGISDSTMTNILFGHHKPRAYVLHRLEKAMDLPPGMLEAVKAQQALEMNNGAGDQR